MWKKLNSLLSIRPEQVTDDKITEFRTKSTEFIRSFTLVYPAKHVTPYMHCMAQHVGDFMSTSGALLPFTQKDKLQETISGHVLIIKSI